MSGGNQVDFDALDAIATSLTDLATTVDGCATTMPTAVDAGEATDGVLDVLALLGELGGRMVVGSAAVSAEVASQNQGYRDADAAAAAGVTRAGG